MKNDFIRPLAPAPLRLVRLTRNEAQARSVIVQRARDCSVDLGGRTWQLTLLPQRAAQAITGGWRVRAEWAGAPFELEVPASACDQWLQAAFPELDLPAMDPPMRAAFLEAALHEALAEVKALQRGPAHIESVLDARGDAPPALPHRFTLVLRREPQLVHATLCTDSLGLMLVAGLAARREPAAGPLQAEYLRITLRAEIGCARLGAGALAALAPGDAIFLEHAWTHQSGELWLGAGHWGLRVRQEDHRLLITQPFNYTESIMDEDFDDARPDGELPMALDGLPVRLHFDLGERSLTLGEVTALQVGQVLDLARPLSQAVNIRANGALVGSGELVEIGGRVAVAITSLGPPREARTPAAISGSPDGLDALDDPDEAAAWNEGGQAGAPEPV